MAQTDTDLHYGCLWVSVTQMLGFKFLCQEQVTHETFPANGHNNEAHLSTARCQIKGKDSNHSVFTPKVICGPGTVESRNQPKDSSQNNKQKQMQNVSGGLAVSTLAAYFYTALPTNDNLIILNYKSHEETIHQKNHITRYNIEDSLSPMKSG